MKYASCLEFFEISKKTIIFRKHLHLVCPRYKYLNENLSTSIDDSREMHLTNVSEREREEEVMSEMNTYLLFV